MSQAVPSTPSGMALRRRSRISGPRSSTIGVHTVPGALALPRIAFGASWFATLTTKPRMRAWPAAYAVPEAPRPAATDDTHVTAPPPRRSRAGTAAWVASSIDLRSTAITRSHSSSVVSISVWRDSMPTLLCSTSSPPQRPTASATIASQSALWVTSAAKASAWPFSARMSPTVSSARSFCASTQSTRAPSRAMRIAVAHPCRLAPAVRAARPPRGARLLGALPAPPAAHAVVGGRAAGAGPRHPAAARHPHRRHADRVASLRRRGRVLARGAVAVGAGARPRQPAGPDRGPGVGARDDRAALDRQAPRLVSARGALAARRRGVGAHAGDPRLRERRAPGRRARARSRRARPDALARPPAADAGRGRDARARPRPGIRRLHDAARRGARRARRAQRAPAAARSGPRDLSQRPSRHRARRALRARGQPLRAHSARLGLRRPRALFDMPRAHPYDTAPAAARRGGEPRAAPPRRAERRPPGLSAAADLRSLGPAAPARHGHRRRRPPARRLAQRPRAGGRRPLRRPSPLHPAGRASAAVRRRVLPQPILRGGGRRPPALGRGGQPEIGRAHV